MNKIEVKMLLYIFPIYNIHANYMNFVVPKAGKKCNSSSSVCRMWAN